MSDNKIISVWAPTGVSKTSYLAALYLAGNKSENFEIIANGPEADTFVINEVENLRTGKFPAPTDVSAVSTSGYLEFKIKRKKKVILGSGMKPYEVAIMDVPGAFTLANSENQADKDEYYRFLREHVGGLLVIFSQPDKNTEKGPSYVGLLDNLMMRFRDYTMPPTAFCIGKVDLDEYWDKRNDPEGLYEDLLGREGMNKIKRHFGLHDFFAYSVVGRCKTPEGDERPNIIPVGRNSFRVLYPDQRQAFGIEEPILWLLKKI
jgi:hypothetical protein